MRRRKNERGIAVTEFALLFPLLVAAIMALVDVSRMVYGQQQLSDLARETANLVSRGTDANSAIDAVIKTSEAFDLNSSGLVIISEVERKDVLDATPWVKSQTTNGSVLYGSRVGLMNSKANIPGITALPVGVSVTTVELVQSFTPAFPSGKLGLDFYPSEIYQAAYF